MHLPVTRAFPHTKYQWVITPYSSSRGTTLGLMRRRRLRSRLRLWSIGTLPQIQIRRRYLLRFSPQETQAPRTYSVQMSKETLRPRIKPSASHHPLLGKAVTLFRVHSHVQRCTAVPPTKPCARLVPLSSMLHPTECKSHRLVLDSTISLILRCMRTTNGPSMTCVALPHLLIKFLSLRLRAMLKNPRDQQPTVPVEIRRERKVVLGLVLCSDSQPINEYGWEGIQLPQTGSVKLGEQTLSKRLLKLSIQVFGGSTGAPHAEPCDSCWDREQQARNRNVHLANLQPYMIDFKSESRTTVLSRPLDDNCLKADVTFHFICYSKHHEGMYK